MEAIIKAGLEIINRKDRVNTSTVMEISMKVSSKKIKGKARES